MQCDKTKIVSPNNSHNIFKLRFVFDFCTFGLSLWKINSLNFFKNKFNSNIFVLFVNFSGPEIDDDDEIDEVENKTPGHGIDDGFFDDKSYPDGPGRGEKFPLPKVPKSNSQPPSRRGSIPAIFPYGPPEYGGPGSVRKLKIYFNYINISWL